MTRDVAELIQAALTLSLEARAALAGSLLESLDAEVDPGVEESWRVEIRRRAAELESGLVAGIAWSEVNARLESILKRGK